MRVKRGLRWLANWGLPVATQGTAHSVGGQSLISGGIILCTAAEPPEWVFAG